MYPFLLFENYLLEERVSYSAANMQRQKQSAEMERQMQVLCHVGCS